MQDVFFDIKTRLGEYTDVIYTDYERESVLLETRRDYLEEVMKLLKTNDYVELDIIFLKEIKKDTYTIIACVPQIIDIFDQEEK